MRIIVQNETGPSTAMKITERKSPKPGIGEVVVKMEAAGINPVDLKVRAGAFELIGKPPFTVGWDISGTIIAIGEGVTNFAPGDAVFGMPAFPAQAACYAEEVAVKANHMVKRPPTFSALEAGAVPLAGLTAWQALITHGKLKSGQTVLIHGAGGGVGHLAIQIAKAHGAKVIATASATKTGFVSDLGADVIIDYAKEDFVKVAGMVDLVLDAFGGDHASRSLDCVAPGCTVVCIIGPSEGSAEKARREGKNLIKMLVEPDAIGLAAIAKLTTTNKLRVHIAKSFALADAARAHDYLETKPCGKVILIP
jgi:NADPH:quinone reductase-like Zn-dependent oxidoreductase